VSCCSGRLYVLRDIEIRRRRAVRKRRVESTRRDGDRRGRHRNAGYDRNRRHIASGGRQGVIIISKERFALGLNIDTVKYGPVGRQPAIRHRTTESLAALRHSTLLAVAAAQRRKATLGRQERREALLEAGSEAAGGAVRGRAVRPARAKFGEAQSAAGEGICEAIVLPSLLCESKECEEKVGRKDGKPSDKLQHSLGGWIGAPCRCGDLTDERIVEVRVLPADPREHGYDIRIQV